MTPEQRRRLAAGPFRIELTNEEILEDLSYPGRPPGRWLDEAPTAHIDATLVEIEREAA
jgi:hypothetical protein